MREKEGIEKIEVPIIINVSKNVKDKLTEMAKESGLTISKHFRKLFGWETVKVYPELFKAKTDKALIGQILIVETALLELVGTLEEMSENITNCQKKETVDYMLNRSHLVTQMFEHTFNPIVVEYSDNTDIENNETLKIMWKSLLSFLKKFQNSKLKIKELIKLSEIDYSQKNEFSTSWIKNEIKRIY